MNKNIYYFGVQILFTILAYALASSYGFSTEGILSFFVFLGLVANIVISLFIFILKNFKIIQGSVWPFYFFISLMTTAGIFIYANAVLSGRI